MDHFELVSEYAPTGDQPQAIEQLVKGFQKGNQCQTLLGVTGSGKTFTMANVIKELNRPTLIIAHNKTLAAQLYSEFKEFFPNNAVEYFVSYYNWQHPIRSLGVRAESLVLSDIPIQFNLFVSEEQREKQEKMDQAVDDIRRRFGYFSVQKAFMYQDKALASLDAQSSHTVHPIGYFNGR